MAATADPQTLRVRQLVLASAKEDRAPFLGVRSVLSVA
jgi:hypothetical protein